MAGPREQAERQDTGELAFDSHKKRENYKPSAATGYVCLVRTGGGALQLCPADSMPALLAGQTLDGLEDGVPRQNTAGDLYRPAELVVSSGGLHQRAHGLIVIEHG